MTRILKIIFVLCVVVTVIVSFSPSYSKLSLDNQANVVAIAIDASEVTHLKVTFQFTSASSVSESGSSSSEKAPSIIYTIEANSVSSAVNLMNSTIGKELNLSHCKLIAISEELAMQGISEELYTLVNNSQVRPSTNIVITKTSAKYYIENSKPLFENLLTKYYEVFTNSSNFTGYTANSTVGDFFNALISNDIESSAILGGVNNESFPSPTSINAQKDSSGKSNESLIFSETRSENFGLAVFKSDKLVGELNSLETLSYLATTNQAEGFLVSIPDPEESNNYLDVYISPIAKTKVKVSIVNNTPYIKVNYNLAGRLYSTEEHSEYLETENLKKISDYCESYLESTFSSYLYRTAKDLKSDINGFGRYSKRQFLTLDSFNEFNWIARYKDSFFDVDVNCIARSSVLLSDT